MHSPPAQFNAVFGVLLFSVIAIFVLLTVILQIFLWWRVFSKAGYSGAMGLIILVPFGILIMLCILAFSNWPVLRVAAERESNCDQLEQV